MPTLHNNRRLYRAFPGRPRRHGLRRLGGALFVSISLALAASQVIGQTSASGSALSEYTSAMARAQPSDRIRDLQRFAVDASGQLRVDALEFIVWEYLRADNRAHALTWANELQAADKDNALAFAVICEGMRDATPTKTNDDRLLNTAAQGISALPQLRRPLGMNESDFSRLRQQTLAMLKGAAGSAELQRKNNLAARSDLREAVALNPSNVPNLYALALADLNGKNPDLKEGYWSLARVTVLSQGTSQGTQIAQYARRRYVDDGGTNVGWDQFLAAAAAAERDLVPKIYIATKSSTNSQTTEARVTAGEQSPVSQSHAASIAKASSGSPTSGKANSTPASAVAEGANPAPPIIRRHRVSNGPISLGILIETSLAQKESRSSVVGALTDMLRHMSDDDEAFILTYDNHLVFEQDLTTDPQQLDEAMKDIKPEKGAVLDEAVAFAAGHLARIAKYPNRVLLVVSDGRNVDSHDSPLQTSAQINAAGVRIYCIGMEVNELDGRYRLQALSSSAGGRSEFVSGPGQFRQATEEIAQNMGIDFHF